jgi:hypothetical protein
MEGCCKNAMTDDSMTLRSCRNEKKFKVQRLKFKNYYYLCSIKYIIKPI